ncbi:hypothetical protein WDU99_08995 [Microbacterium sp. Mu-80]|uniref:CU044_5270 family protein n=1 Tax=Microbacterium bandirmense TaxID=3122050 RepID=A0ABU8LDM9_9MICO
MNVTEDDLDRIFRAVRPNRTHNGLDAKRIALREDIIRGTHTTPRTSKRPRFVWAGLTAGIASVAVAAFVAASVLAPGHQASALTPPKLHYSSAPALADVIETARQTLASSAGPRQMSHVESVSWGWSVEIEESRIESVPQAITFDWAPGEPASATILAGDSYWSGDDRPPGVRPSPYQPGDLIDEIETSAADLTLPGPLMDLADADAGSLEAALEVFGIDDDPTSGELLAAIDGVMQYWTLSNAQQSHLLDLLAATGDVRVRGATTDRVGREVIGLEVSSPVPERTSTLFVSADSGRLVGIETELSRPFEDLPAGVISYTMWDADL